LFLPTGSGVNRLMSNGARLVTLAPGCWGAVALPAVLRGAPLPTVPALVAGSPALGGATVGAAVGQHRASGLC
jgi:hypothetical protein